MSVRWLVGCFVGWSVYHNFLKGREVTHTFIGALVKFFTVINTKLCPVIPVTWSCIIMCFFFKFDIIYCYFQGTWGSSSLSIFFSLADLFCSLSSRTVQSSALRLPLSSITSSSSVVNVVSHLLNLCFYSYTKITCNKFLNRS